MHRNILSYIVYIWIPYRLDLFGYIIIVEIKITEILYGFRCYIYTRDSLQCGK